MGKKVEHTTFRNEKLFCTHCGGDHAIPFPCAIPIMTAMLGAFNKMHADCEKVWEEPVVDPSLSIVERKRWWWKNGERGVSSETMYSQITGLYVAAREPLGHPHDPDDFRRCYLLLETIPEWKEELNKLRPVSPVWDKLVDNWDKLTKMLEEQMETKKDNGMYKFMQELGC